MRQSEESPIISPRQPQEWARYWLDTIRRLPRVVSEPDLDALRLILFAHSPSNGIDDGAARVRYLVSSKLLPSFLMRESEHQVLSAALKAVFDDGDFASQRLAELGPALIVGSVFNRPPHQSDLDRMGLEYRSGFALSPLTILFCKMHSIIDGPSLFSAINDESRKAEFFRTLSSLCDSSH